MKQYMTAPDVSEVMGVGLSKAYAFIKQMNTELEEKGFLTVRGKVPSKYFQERTYGFMKEESEN